MEVRWSPEAVNDLETIVRHILPENPSAARNVAAAIYKSISSLSTFPNRGRLGRIRGTRELILSPLPWIAVYRVRAEIELIRIYHGAQDWP